MSQVLLEKIVDSVAKIADASTKEYFSNLATQIHVADVSFNALKTSAQTLTESEHFGILDAFNNIAAHSSQSLTNAVRQIKSDNWSGLVFVSDPKLGDFLISKNKNALRRTSVKVFRQLESAYPSTFDLAESRLTYTAGVYQQTTTPLLSKLRDIYSKLPVRTANKVAGEIIKLQHEYAVTSTYAPSNIEELSSVLGRGTVLVTFRDKLTASQLAGISGQIGTRVKQHLSKPEILQSLVSQSTLADTISLKLREALGAKVRKPAPMRAGTQKKKPVIPKDKSRALPFVPVPLQDLRGKFFSLEKLKQLLNFHLHDVVAANMGDGDRKDILNYRTGRFATSTEVERVTQSRQGALTVFYSYMKYPYATFSAGGRQQNPRSRDPKLLIAKSIRDIASQHVSNALRSVNV